MDIPTLEDGKIDLSKINEWYPLDSRPGFDDQVPVPKYFSVNYYFEGEMDPELIFNITNFKPRLVPYNEENMEIDEVTGKPKHDPKGLHWYSRKHVDSLVIPLQTNRLNSIVGKVHEMNIKNRSHFEKEQIMYRDYYVASTVRSQIRFGESMELENLHRIMITFDMDQTLNIIHSQQSLFSTLTKLGSFLGGIMAIFKGFHILLNIKYKNRQARVVEEYEQEAGLRDYSALKCNLELKERQRKNWCVKYFHIRSLKQWFLMDEVDKDAYLRLGRKISYISLYQYAHTVDKQYDEIETL